MKSSTIWILSIVGFLLLASGQLTYLFGTLINTFGSASGSIFNDYVGSDGTTHSGLIRFIIIIAIVIALVGGKKKATA